MKKLFILTILFVVSCSSNEDLEQVSLNQFEEDALNVKSVVIKGDIVEVETFDGRKYEVVYPTYADYSVENVLSDLNVEINYEAVAQPSIWSQLLIGSLPLLGIIVFIFLFLAVWAAYLASNRNQSKALWFFLTLIFPIAILFIATKDRIKKN
jgi:ATP-dependent Zn proteases